MIFVLPIVNFLSANPVKWANTLEHSVGCLTIGGGGFCLKGDYVFTTPSNTHDGDCENR